MKIRKPNRLKSYDYSLPGYYFITICSDKHKPYFSKIKSDKIFLNTCGDFVKLCWNKIPDHFPLVSLDDFIIMPNHIHGILIIDYENKLINKNSLLNEKFHLLHRTNLSNVIKGFKIGVTKWARKNYIHDFKWQKF